jgi:hypothetical protein
MLNFQYKKETFIYEKNNSITEELCTEIIEMFDNNNNININTNIDFLKIKIVLFKELKLNILKYNKKINKIESFNLLNLSNLFINNDNIEFYIDKNNNNNNNNNNNIFNRLTNKKFKILFFMWFLNEYDGEICFFNDYKIKPKIGKFIMFPVSWCYNYKEIINIQNNKYMIYGYICKII